jgi:hypothetical protein
MTGSVLKALLSILSDLYEKASKNGLSGGFQMASGKSINSFKPGENT